MEKSHSLSITADNLKNTTIKYRDAFDFLSKHIHQKNPHSTNPKPVTNTRIGDPKLNIHGGSYHIEDSEYESFLRLYADDVLVKKKKEYLSEFMIGLKT